MFGKTSGKLRHQQSFLPNKKTLPVAYVCMAQLASSTLLPPPLQEQKQGRTRTSSPMIQLCEKKGDKEEATIEKV